MPARSFTDGWNVFGRVLDRASVLPWAVQPTRTFALSVRDSKRSTWYPATPSCASLSVPQHATEPGTSV
ncbi:MAG: hypothetical protein ACK515_24915 [bacterium]|nr:hypothetical protein [Betaproteobacteria bacterium]